MSARGRNRKTGDNGRRRFLALLGIAAGGGVALPWLVRARGGERRILSLREADYYRRDDLAG